MFRLYCSVVLSILLFGCGNSANKQKEDWQSITSHISSIPERMHPLDGNDAGRSEIFNYLHGFLVREDIKNFSSAPGVLHELPSFNAETIEYLFKLNPNVTFDDGSSLTVEDVFFTFKVNVCPEVINGSRKTIFEFLEELEVIDGYTFKAKYSEANIQDVSLWSLFPILQKAYYDSAGVFDNFSYADVKTRYDEVKTEELEELVKELNGPKYGSQLSGISGVGPYEVYAWEETQIVLRKKKEHWTQKSKQWFHNCRADEIVFKLASDQNKFLELKNQLVDVSIGIRSSQMKEVQADTGITNHYNAYNVPVYGFSLIGLNMRPDMVGRSSIFTDQLVRKAFAYSLPVQDAMDKLSSGSSRRIASPISVNKPEYKKDLVPYPFDLDKCRELLKEAGWADSNGDGVLEKTIDGKEVPLRIGLCIRNNPFFESIAKLLVEGLKQGGFDAYVDPRENWAEVLQKTHDYDAILFSMSSSFGPDYPFSMFTEENFPDGNNFVGYANPRINELEDQVNTTFDANKRMPLLMEFQDIVYDELPYVYISSGTRGILAHKKLGDLAPSGAMPFLMLNTLTSAESQLE